MNPPGRGLGARHDGDGNPLVAAFLWVKAPGESDGDAPTATTRRRTGGRATRSG